MVTQNLMRGVALIGHIAARGKMQDQPWYSGSRRDFARKVVLEVAQ